MKYFNLKAIAEFGSNTFMATGTNTVTLFLERKTNNEWKKIETAIKNFFDKPKEATVNGIEKAFSKYVSEIFEGLELADYISLVNKDPNENIQKQELFADYKTWFASLTEIKQLKKKKAFKDKTETEQKDELDKLFYEKIFAREQDKMLYFFLVYPQQTVLIKVGEKQAEKDFIGYEFSSRRGHEGIKMYRDENGKPITKLYDDYNYLNPEKANSYVYRSYLQEKFSVEESLTENIINFDTLELIDFKHLVFEKKISLGTKKKVQLNSKWELVRLQNILSVLESGNRPKGGVGKYKSGIPSLGGEHIGLYGQLNLESMKYVPEDFYNQSNRGIIKPFDILLCKDGALTGKVSIVPDPMPFEKGMINEHVFILRTNDKASQEFLFYFLYYTEGQSLLKSNITGQAQGGLSSKNLKNIRIPLPPKSVQDQIITEINAIIQKEKARQNKLVQLNSQLNNLFSSLDYPVEKLGNLAEFKNGLNYSEKSKGDLVTIVGVKDFLEDFSPNLEKLVDVRIDGKLSESYKLQPEDILVVRSNGSANLVGRFIYIAKLLKETSYSGFTIRIRTNSNKINSKYLCYCLRTESVRNAITKDPRGANIKSINQTMLSSINIPLPDIKEQLKILERAEKLEKEISVIETDLTKMDSEKEQILKGYLE